MHKVIVIVGPTAAGKSDLAVQVAKHCGGEVVSADSRQVYKGLHLGSGKITEKEMLGIPHHLLNIASPKRTYTVAQYQKTARMIIKQIQDKGKIPVLVGGSPQYLYSVIDGVVFPAVRPNSILRKQLEKLDIATLYKQLEKRDPRRASEIEIKNKRRLIRALEIIEETGQPVPSFRKLASLNSFLILGITYPMEVLKKRIATRLQKRLKIGMIEEIRQLQKEGLSWERLENFGLEYRHIALYLQGKVSRKEMISQLQKDIEHFAKRQMTWFKKDSRIRWIRNTKEATSLVKDFLL